jgi:hypothetical protein
MVEFLTATNGLSKDKSNDVFGQAPTSRRSLALGERVEAVDSAKQFVVFPALGKRSAQTPPTNVRLAF